MALTLTGFLLDKSARSYDTTKNICNREIEWQKSYSR